MQESRARVATLEDVDVDTFVGFYEFACTGDYRAPAGTPAEDNFVLENMLGPSHDRSKEASGPKTVGPSSERLLEENDEVAESDLPLEPDPCSTIDFWGRGISDLKKNKKGKNIYYNHFGPPNAPSSPPAPPSLPSSTSTKLWHTFQKRKFDLPQQSSWLQQSSLTPVRLMFHAKLYTFAEKNLIERLQTCCLGHLHRELRDLQLN